MRGPGRRGQPPVARCSACDSSGGTSTSRGAFRLALTRTRSPTPTASCWSRRRSIHDTLEIPIGRWPASCRSARPAWRPTTRRTNRLGGCGTPPWTCSRSWPTSPPHGRLPDRPARRSPTGHRRAGSAVSGSVAVVGPLRDRTSRCMPGRAAAPQAVLGPSRGSLPLRVRGAGSRVCAPPPVAAGLGRASRTALRYRGARRRGRRGRPDRRRRRRR